MASTAFRATTIVNPPSAASGVITFDVADGTALGNGLAAAYPQAARNNPVVRAKQAIDLTISAISAGGTVTATVVTSTTDIIGADNSVWIIEMASGQAFNVAVTLAATTLDSEVTSVAVTSTPGASSGVVRALVVNLITNPSANQPSVDASAIMAFVYHLSGNFTQAVLRALGGTATQSAAGTVDELRGAQGLVVVTAGVATKGIGVDSSWAMSGGSMGSFVAFRSRQGTGTFPTAEYGIVCYGYNQFEKGLTIGSFTSPVNVSLAILQALTASAGAALAINIANAFTAAANSDTFYGINIGQSITKGAFTGLVYYGISLTIPTASGAGTVATAAQIYLELPTIATNNYFMRFAGVLDATALGAYQGRIKVLTSAGTGYVPVYAA